MFQFPGFASIPLCIQGKIPSFDNWKYEPEPEGSELAIPVIEGGSVSYTHLTLPTNREV